MINVPLPTPMWWGYKHVNGNYQVKPYFDYRDIEDAYESPFVEKVFQRFPATNREEAFKFIANLEHVVPVEE